MHVRLHLRIQDIPTSIFARLLSTGDLRPVLSASAAAAAKCVYNSVCGVMRNHKKDRYLIIGGGGGGGDPVNCVGDRLKRQQQEVAATTAIRGRHMEKTTFSARHRKQQQQQLRILWITNAIASNSSSDRSPSCLRYREWGSFYCS